MAAALVTLGTLIGAACQTPEPTQAVTQPNVWLVGDPSPLGDTTLSTTGLSIYQGGHTRQATLVEPAERAGDERLPVVIMLHGLGFASYDAMSSGNWFSQLADNHLIGVFPDGISRSWNAGSCCKPSSVSGLDDVGFLTSLTTLMQQRADVDPSRIYMVGFSNGGMMVYRFLCAHADMLAGAASVDGTSVAHCPPSTGIRLMHVAGTADAVIPYNGGPSQALITFGSGSIQGVVISMNDLVTNDGCQQPPYISGYGTGVSTQQWVGCENGTVHELVTLLGAGHVWPVGGAFDGTTEVLRFFGLLASGPPATTTTTEAPTTTTTTTEDPTTTTSEDPTTTVP
jgi:polyhydroxybutyrate depolymerase